MNLSAFFKNEVKPALGCTEPGAVALAAASASKHFGKKIDKINLELSGNVYKNGLNVGIPGTGGETGNILAATLGVLAGNPDKGLKSLEDIKEADIEKAKSLIESGAVTQKVALDVPNVYVKVTLRKDEETASATITGRHDNLTNITLNDKTIYNKDKEIKKNSKKTEYIEELEKQDMESLWNLSSGISDDLEEYLLEGSKMNIEAAEQGLADPWGLGIGYSINKIESTDILYMIKAYASAATDTRMGGKPWPIMSSAGSGNHGITAIIPPTLYAREKGNTQRELAEALALSHLVTRFIKIYTGLLTPICGCAVAAGAGATASIVKLAGGTPKQAEIAVASLMSSLMGMTCDGGKGSCALKVSTAAGEAYLNAVIALMDGGLNMPQGVLKPDLGYVAKILGEISDKGLKGMDESMLSIIQRQ